MCRHCGARLGLSDETREIEIRYTDHGGTRVDRVMILHGREIHRCVLPEPRDESS